MKTALPRFRRRQLTPHIDMTPLIDCVFTLLIVFMVGAAFQSPMIQLTLPQAATRDPAPNPEILVSVNDRGEFFLNGESADPDRLADRLRPLLARSRDRTVTFRGDEKTPYELFVKALDAARIAGAEHFDIDHQEPGGR